MVSPRPGVVVLVRFPFSDLSSSKLRPAVVHAGGPDWILCQVTSNRYSDAAALPLPPGAFGSGGLGRESFARPGKLFTASQELAVRSVGTLTAQAHKDLVARVVAVLQSGVR